MMTVGYMPIIQAPAHQLDTLHTVVLRCKHIARQLGQQHVVITVNEALFWRVMEFKWAKPEYQDFLIVRLGGLHIAMNFLQIIGKHVQGSGLLEAWIESNIFGPGTAEQVMSGKSYARGMRGHKLTLQALWRLLVPKLLIFIKATDQGLEKDLQDGLSNDGTDVLLRLCVSPHFSNAMDSFVSSNDNPNFQFWWTYMKMVKILLLFTRAHREGLW